MAGKSIAFCRPAPAGGTALLVLCEVEVGNKHDTCATAPTVQIKQMHKQGRIAYLAPGNNDFNKWKDAGEVHPDLTGVQMPDISGGRSPSKAAQSLGQVGGTLGHNEWVVYDPAQIRQRYLFQIQVLPIGA